MSSHPSCPSYVVAPCEVTHFPLLCRLAGQRPNRDKSAIPQEQLKQFSEKQSVAIHKASDPGLLAVDVHALDADMIVTGGMDNTAVLFNHSQKKKMAVLSGHSKPVSQVAFHPED